MAEVLIRYVSSLATQFPNGRIYVDGIPERGGGADEVEAAGAVHLVLVVAVSHLAQAVEEDGASEGITGLAFVEARGPFGTSTAGRSAGGSSSTIPPVASSTPTSSPVTSGRRAACTTSAATRPASWSCRPPIQYTAMIDHVLAVLCGEATNQITPASPLDSLKLTLDIDQAVRSGDGER